MRFNCSPFALLGSATVSLFLSAFVFCPLYAETPEKKDWNVRDLAKFEFLRDGKFSNSGANLFLSAAGNLGPIHSWDYNGDGYADIVFNNTHDHAFEIPARIYLNRDGLPDSRNAVELPGSGATAIAVADLNGDGLNDIVVVNGNNNTTGHQSSYIYWGGKDGWHPDKRQELPTLQGSHVSVADLNNDGHLDLIISNRGDIPGEDKESYIYWGDGKGFDCAHRTTLRTDGASCSVVGDFNHDGYPDVAFGNRRGGGIVIYWGGKDGFKNFRSTQLGDQKISSLHFGDVDGDGVPDLLITDLRDGLEAKSGFYRGGEKGFGAFVPLPVANATAASVGDFCKEGRPQIAIASYKDNVNCDSEITVFSRDISGAWLPTAKIPTKRTVALSTGDVNKDGFDDLLAAEYCDRQSKSISSHLFLGSRSGLQMESSRSYPTDGASDALLADADGDGKLDVLFANSSTGRTYGDIPAFVYWGNPASRYSQENLTKLPAVGGYNSVMADFDDDGFTDVLLVSSGEDDPKDFLGKASCIYWGSKDGLSPDRKTELPKGARGFGATTADLNGDGYLDIILGDLDGHAIRIYWGSPKGFTSESLQLLKGGSPMFVRAVDLNGDGLLDIVSPRIGDNNITIYWNSPEGFHESDFSQIMHSAPSVAEFADLNGDGWIDMVVGGFWDASTQDHRTASSIYWGGPQGFSNYNRTLLQTSGVHDISISDLNRDGHLDLVFSCYHGNSTRAIDSYIYWGNGADFSEARRTALPTFSAAGNLVLDLNEDGWPDIVFSNHNKNNDHRCDSVIYWGSAQGFSRDQKTMLPAVGPHQMADVDVGNLMTRVPEEEYISPPIDLGGSGQEEVAFSWVANLPRGTGLEVFVRAAASGDLLDGESWGVPIKDGVAIERLSRHRYVQFRVRFLSLTGAAQPQLRGIKLLTR